MEEMNRLRILKASVCSVLCIVMCFAFTAAYAEETIPFTFELTEEGNAYSVTGYTGKDTNIVVPDLYMGMPVTEIGDGAFQGNKSLTEVSLPSCITRIGVAGFKGCTALAVITTYEAAEPSGRIPGDADGNGVVDAKDTLLVLKFGAGDKVEINTLNADVDQDGLVDLNDALLLMRYGAGWDVELQ